MTTTFGYNFGFDGSLNKVGKENVKETIAEYFDERDDTDLVEFVGNVTPPPADIMRVKVKTGHSVGYDLIDDLANKELDHGIYIIQGGVD